MSNVLIITGGSKGIGKAIAELYSANNYIVYSLARTNTEESKIKEISVDLSDLNAATTTLQKIIREILTTELTSITLINNAGRLGKISNLENIPTEDLYTSILLNTTIPLALSSVFIKELSEVNCEKNIISISSGAATNPYNGWSVYCSSKAALDMMTATIATEQGELSNGVSCFGIRPGVVDTNMQSEIRNTDVSDFKNVERFRDLKKNEQLYSPEYVAKRIFDLHKTKRLQNGKTIDLRTV
jgi:benzil reductase ((S)-benzoin forming)